MTNSNSGRIPANKSSSFTTWQMPEVKQGQVVAVEKLNKRGPRGELVGVKQDELIYKGLTAGQLNEITQQAYEDVRQQAYQEGHQQGHGEGYQAGLQSGQQAIQQQLSALHNTLHSLHNILEEQDDEMEQALVNLSTCVAQSILRRELNMDASHITEVVREAVACLPKEEDRIKVYISASDYTLLAEQPGLPPQWNLEVDHQMSAGGCRVTNSHSVVEYSLEEQFQQTINAIVEQRYTELAKQARQRYMDQSTGEGQQGLPPTEG
jgi:flagellar assembly protein FliH